MIFAALRAATLAAASALLVSIPKTAVATNSDTTVPSDSIAALASALDDSIPLAGHVVYLDFWASWCAPCRSSFPWMTTLLEKYRAQGLIVVTVDLDATPAAGRKFLSDMKATFPVVFDPKGLLAKQYRLEAMPTSFVYGRDGKLEKRHEGFAPRDSAALEALIASLLKEDAPQ